MTSLVERLRVRLANWRADEPEDDWWAYQHEYREAADTIEAMLDACFKSRHRLLKEGFLPEDPTVRALNAAIERAQS